MSNPLHTLPRATPESQGISSKALLAFIESADTELDALHSFMLVRHGNIVAEGWWTPYAAELTHVLFSLSKSFCSTAAGLAAAEGKFALTDTVLSFFPDDAPAEVSENLAKMTVHDLLAMATGNAEDTTGYLHRDPDGNWVKAFLARPVEHTPGTHFVYNSGATYMVSAIVQKTTGQTLLEYLTPRLFEPLGIVGATWESCPRGINVGGWGLKVMTEDIAKFGQLYLQDGVWNGERLLPEGWVATATSKQVSNGTDPNNDWNQGYGYQFWRCRHGAYRGDGAFGQYCIVLPEKELVIAITSGIGNMGAVLNLIWDKILPALEDKAMPEDSNAEAALKQRLSTLSLRGPVGETTSAVAAQVTGNTYPIERFEDRPINDFSYTFKNDSVELTVRGADTTETLSCGLSGEWKFEETDLFSFPRYGRQKIGLTGAWTAADTFVVNMAFRESPFILTVRNRFTDSGVEIEMQENVAFGGTPVKKQTGTLIGK